MVHTIRVVQASLTTSSSTPHGDLDCLSDIPLATILHSEHHTNFPITVLWTTAS